MTLLCISFLVIGIVVLQSLCNDLLRILSCIQTSETRLKKLTVLVEDLLTRCFPFCLWKHLYNDDITIDGAVHALASHKQDRFTESLGIDVSLKAQWFRYVCRGGTLQDLPPNSCKGSH